MWDDAEKSIAKLPGVHSCRITLADGSIDQVVVSALITGRDEEARLQQIKSVVRSITGLLALEYDIKLDYRKVKVLELDGTGEPGSAQPNRIKIIAAYTKFLNPPEVWVELDFADEVTVGRSVLGRDKLESGFSAFKQAFDQLGLGQVTLLFITEASVPLNRYPLLVVKVAYTDPYGETTELLGVVENKDDLLLSTVRASLDALNRRVRC